MLRREQSVQYDIISLGQKKTRKGKAKTEKQNHAQEKKEKKLVYKEAWENLYASLTSVLGFV